MFFSTPNCAKIQFTDNFFDWSEVVGRATEVSKNPFSCQILTRRVSLLGVNDEFLTAARRGYGGQHSCAFGDTNCGCWTGSGC
jgi:hypothetical protein